jgi:hypothetical protein
MISFVYETANVIGLALSASVVNTNRVPSVTGCQCLTSRVLEWYGVFVVPTLDYSLLYTGL